MQRKPDLVITVQSPSGLQIFKVWAVHPALVPPDAETVHRISNPDGTVREDLVLVTKHELRLYGMQAKNMAVN